jgi:hypothetical protein
MKLYYHPISTPSRPIMLFAFKNRIPLDMHVEVAKLKFRAVADDAKIVRTNLAGTQIIYHAH